MNSHASTPESDNDAESMALQLLDSIAAPFDIAESRTKKIGGREVTYIGGTAVIRRMNEVFAGEWSSTLVSPPTVVQMSVERWDETTRSKQPVSMPCLVACVEVYVPRLNARHVGMGVQLLEHNAGEDVAKGCIVDATKNALRYFGLGEYLRDGDAPARHGGGQRHDSGAADFNPNSPSWNEPASDRQKKWFRDLVAESNLSPNAIRQQFGWPADTTADNLTRGQASTAITKLREQLGK